MGFERAHDRRRELARFLHPDAERADLLGNAREVDRPVGPELARLLRLLPAVDAVEAALGLIAARVVVHDGDRVDLPSDRRFDFADVVPQAGVAGKHDDGPLWSPALRSESRRERPAEMPRAPHVALGA